MVNQFGDVKAIYFDLDDTLCGYWDASKSGLRATFDRLSPEGYAPDEMISHWAASFREFAPTLKQTNWYQGYLLKGEPTRTEQMRLTLVRLGIEDLELAAMLSQAYMEERDRALALFPDAIEVLDKLKGRYPLGLITNGPADVQRQEIQTLGISDYFDHVFIEGEMGEGKPLQAVFDRAAKVVDCKPHELLMVGNSFGHDINAAINFGWHAVWIRRESDVPPSVNGVTEKPEPKPEGSPEPDATISELRELLPLLGL